MKIARLWTGVRALVRDPSRTKHQTDAATGKSAIIAAFLAAIWLLVQALNSDPVLLPCAFATNRHLPEMAPYPSSHNLSFEALGKFNLNSPAVFAPPSTGYFRATISQMDSIRRIGRAILVPSLAIAQLAPSMYDNGVSGHTLESGNSTDYGSVGVLPQANRPDWPSWAPNHIPQGVDRQCEMVQTGGYPKKCHNSKDCDYLVYSRNYTSDRSGHKNKYRCAAAFHENLWKGKLVFVHWDAQLCDFCDVHNPSCRAIKYILTGSLYKPSPPRPSHHPANESNAGSSYLLSRADESIQSPAVSSFIGSALTLLVRME